MGDKRENNGEVPVTVRLPDPADSVTRRFPDADRVTRRFDESLGSQNTPAPISTEHVADDSVTQRFDLASQPDAAFYSILRPGDLVADRYRVEEGPLGGPTGEAEVYRCIDTQTNEMVALKRYHARTTPKESVLTSLLNLHHPDLIAIRDYGVWGGRFFEVMEYCAGGTLVDYPLPLDEGEMKEYLRELVNALQFLHGSGVVHRDVKPNNLLFRKPGKQDLVLGDFGISSMLLPSEKVRMTTTAGYHTLDYAAPELLGGHEVGPKTDYYALGVTLIHLLSGKSPMEGMDPNQILRCHFQNTVPIPDCISSDFRRLIKGFLRTDPKARWGYNQAHQWLKGEDIRTDDGKPDFEAPVAGRSLPYPRYPSVATPREMLEHLADIPDIRQQLARGFVSQWLTNFDANLAAHVAKLEDVAPDWDADLCKFKLRYLLDPSEPLRADGNNLHDLTDIVSFITRHPSPDQSELAAMLYDGRLTAWIDATQETGDIPRLVSRIAKIAQRVTSRSLGMFCLLHLLHPAQPLALGPGVTIAAPEELEEAITTHPEILPRVTEYLYDGHFAQWLRLAFPDRTDDIAFVGNCVSEHPEDRELGVWTFRWRLQPALPFPIGRESASSPGALAALICRDTVSFDLGVAALKRGALRDWLTSTGRLTDPRPFDDVANSPDLSWPRKMEALVHLLHPGIPHPKAACNVRRIDAGRVSPESYKRVSVRVRNAGRGYLAGTISLTHIAGGFAINHTSIEGKPVDVEITIYPLGLPVGSRQNTSLRIETNGGDIEIPITYAVGAPLLRMAARSILAGLVMGAILGVLRLFIFGLDASLQTVDWASMETTQENAAQWTVYIVGASVLSTLTLCLVYFVVQSLWQTRDSNTRDDGASKRGAHES